MFVPFQEGEVVFKIYSVTFWVFLQIQVYFIANTAMRSSVYVKHFKKIASIVLGLKQGCTSASPLNMHRCKLIVFFCKSQLSSKSPNPFDVIIPLSGIGWHYPLWCPRRTEPSGPAALHPRSSAPGTARSACLQRVAQEKFPAEVTVWSRVLTKRLSRDKWCSVSVICNHFWTCKIISNI